MAKPIPTPWCDNDTDGEIPPEPCKGSWDYNGDFWRCECGTRNQSGRCERKDSSTSTTTRKG